MYNASRLSLLALFAATIATSAFGAPSSTAQHTECTGTKVIYPKQNDSFRENQSVYLILGNESQNLTLEKVSILRHTDQGMTLSKDMPTATGAKDEPLSRIVVFQEELKGLDTALPDRFTFRVYLTQDGQRCTVDSPEFEVTAESSN